VVLVVVSSKMTRTPSFAPVTSRARKNKTRGQTNPSPPQKAQHKTQTTKTKNNPPTKQGGGGGLPNPFDMGKLMESVKKAQQMVQVETARVQKELDE